MKKIFVFCLLLGLSSPAFANIDYSRVIEDLPLMQGMDEKADTAIIFDKPEGRIIDLSADIQAEAETVLRFYDSALPSLGWQIVSTGRYTRGNEELVIFVESNKMVRFSLSPRKVTP